MEINKIYTTGIRAGLRGIILSSREGLLILEAAYHVERGKRVSSSIIGSDGSQAVALWHLSERKSTSGIF